MFSFLGQRDRRRSIEAAGHARGADPEAVDRGAGTVNTKDPGAGHVTEAGNLNLWRHKSMSSLTKFFNEFNFWCN